MVIPAGGAVSQEHGCMQEPGACCAAGAGGWPDRAGRVPHKDHAAWQAPGVHDHAPVHQDLLHSCAAAAAVVRQARCPAAVCRSWVTQCLRGQISADGRSLRRCTAVFEETAPRIAAFQLLPAAQGSEAALWRPDAVLPRSRLSARGRLCRGAADHGGRGPVRAHAHGGACEA